MKNIQLVPARRQLFETPLSEEQDFYSVAFLLQEVGSWMVSTGVQDPEFDALVIERVFPNPESDESRHTATLFYRKETDSL